jgi:hypothetical protein
MKAKLLLSEAATGHPDGTISMLRAGITHVWTQPNPPYGLQAALVSRIEADLGDAGQHQFDLRCMNDDGAEVMPRLAGQFAVASGGGTNNLILNFNTVFPKPGRYTFVLRVDNVQLDQCSVQVTPAPAGQLPGPPGLTGTPPSGSGPTPPPGT